PGQAQEGGLHCPLSIGTDRYARSVRTDAENKSPPDPIRSSPPSRARSRWGLGNRGHPYRLHLGPDSGFEEILELVLARSERTPQVRGAPSTIRPRRSELYL